MALNPVAFTEKIVANFLRYQITAYPFADARLHAQMRDLLSLEQTRRTPLLQGPYVSLSRSFRSGATVKSFADEGVLHPHIVNLAAYPAVYGHQEQAIRAIHARKTTLVSTGTGSGKTECFLYPIISRCLELRDAQAPAGIVGVVVYPMNALAEDQLLRLRDLLAGTGIAFGMYVGKTPEEKADVSGQRVRPGASREDYRAEVARAQQEKRKTAVHPAEERCSRQEMRAEGGQPRILLTNVKQLELLLTRQRDAELFAGASLEYLVFDEAHTFSGAIGAESACLVRRLRAFCGRSPEQTVCVATSATIADPKGDPEAGRKFASRFFGVAAKDVALIREEYEEDVWGEDRRVPRAPASSSSALAAVLRAVEAADDGASNAVCAEVADAYRGLCHDAIPPEAGSAALYDRLASNDVVYALAHELVRPRRIDELPDTVAKRVGRPVSEEEVLAWLTLGAAAKKDGRALLRPVVHAFVRGIDGAVVSFPDDADEPQLWLSAEDEVRASGDAPAMRLPLTSCSVCGQHYFVHFLKDFDFKGPKPGGGDAVEDRSFWPALEATHGGKRVVLLDRLVSADEDDDPDDAPGRTVALHFCRRCGAGHPEPRDRCDGCGASGALVRLFAVPHKEGAEGWLTRCVCCGSLGAERGASYREPARPVRAVDVANVHVLAQEMVHHAERPRLLVFADNRQDAAFQAGWMRDRARRFRLRALMESCLRTGPLSVGDLVSKLDDIFEKDDELSESLLAEVWNVQRKEAAGARHSQERRYFLRIQVLRELVTGVKQRVGLEPWGRLRADYVGLAAETPWIVEKAKTHGLDPAGLAEGVAGLLDQLRRTYHLLDREQFIFSRFWGDGDRELQQGYIPKMPGIPKGMKLRREKDDDAGRITQWLSRSSTTVRQVVRKWGIDEDHVVEFVEEMWKFLTSPDVAIVSPVTLLGYRRNALPNCAGAFQIDADKIRLTPTRGVWRCRTCRRSRVRTAPGDLCPAWHCDGNLERQDEDRDNYDLRLLDENYRMLRPREHSAQVPQVERERIELAFKGTAESVNALVCTPTLELGVDIGALDSVLMRNVPPLPANYWQRVGRAGRRHRMAVNVTHCRARSHDRAYFADPVKLLAGRVDPPSFNLRNPLMVAKHVHATVLTRLHQLAKGGGGLSEFDAAEVQEALDAVFPSQVTNYLFHEDQSVRVDPFDVGGLRTVVSKHEADVVAYVRRVFAQGWPEDDGVVVRDEVLLEVVRATPDALADVIATLKRRLDWALAQMRRLEETRRRKGTLDQYEDALYQRCDRVVKRFKGYQRRKRREAEGQDEINTMSVLAAEGFLPGYGLEVGQVVGHANVPRTIAGAQDFDLPRVPSLAVMEFVPGNLIYANGHRFAPRYYHLEPEEKPLLFSVDPRAQCVREAGAGARAVGVAEVASASAGALRGVPICDVDLMHFAQIQDDEDYRFQLPVAVFGYELGRHSRGMAYRWGTRDLHLRGAVHLRLVNVGVARLVQDGDPERFGYPVCLACGQSMSPFSSHAARDEFVKGHQERCQRRPAPTAFYADAIADAMTLPRCATRTEAYSLAEALRFGAAEVLDMEREDLRILVIGQPGTDECDAVLFDPMPGGSGLLQQICDRFSEVWAEARDLAARCPSECRSSCIDCFQTFRNAFYHRHLDRHVALECLKAWGRQLTPIHEIPPKMPSADPSGASMPSNRAEARLREMLKNAGFPEPVWQHQLQLGRPLGTTTPDCFFPGDDESDPGTTIYLDGLSDRLHGNERTRQQDRAIREQLRSKGYEVFEIPAQELDDRGAMQRHFFRLARVLLGKDAAQRVRDDAHWFGVL